jgi:acylphosphatase
MNSEDAEDRICRQYFVCGVVQGVFFRDSAREQAHRLNLSGYAKNLPDGTVEIVACGSAGNIAKMFAWLSEGPPMATVDAIEERIVPDRQFSGFTIA